MKVKAFEMIKGDDMHCHLRTGVVLKSVVDFTSKYWGRAIIMPNTTPKAVLTADIASAYRNAIKIACHDNFEPLMTIQINDKTTPAMIAEAKKAGVVAGKVYPKGVTTNSENGVIDLKSLYPVFEAMQEQDILLLLHGEMPGENVFCLDREEIFLKELIDLNKRLCNLKIVLEHITTSAAVECIRRLGSNVAATITVHHLILTLNDVSDGKLHPHNFCMPIAKRPTDRAALIEAATSGHFRFFYGGDSAPHLEENKECSEGCAGVFNAPIALQLLAQIFEEAGKLDRLENFTSKFGAEFYGLSQNSGIINLVKKDWTVPNSYPCGESKIIPFMAGQTLHWQVEE